MIGSNVDFRHWHDLDALSADLSAHNVRSVRTVLKWDDGASTWFRNAHAADLTVCSVFAQESLGGHSVEAALEHYANYEWDILQLGNESSTDCYGMPDCASWYQTQEEVNYMARIARSLLPDSIIIGPGLADGDPHWLDTLDTSLFNGIAAHPYGVETPEQMDAFIEAYSAYGSLYITEYPFVQFTRQLNDDPRVVGAWHFCWSNRMHPLGIRENPVQLATFTEGAQTVAGLDVGQGLWDYVVAQGDQPIEDWEVKQNQNGTRIEIVRGGKGIYWGSNAQGPNGEPGEFVFYGPFGS